MADLTSGAFEITLVCRVAHPFPSPRRESRSGILSAFLPPDWRTRQVRYNLCSMFNTPALIHLNSDEGPAISAVGDVYRVLATGEQTGGAYALLEARVLPGGGPPPHLHTREEESFFVLEGELTFLLEGRPIRAGVGAFIQIPRGTVHCFKNESATPTRILIQVTPSGFEQFMAEFAVPVPSFASPPVPVTPVEIERLLAVAPKYGIEMKLPH